MTEPPILVKAADAADLLRYLPALAGVPTDDSLVVLLFRDRRTAGAIRLDLPRTADRLHLTRWASTVIGTACRLDGVTGIVPVVCTPETFAPSGRPPCAPVLRAVSSRARSAGLTVKDELCVAADGWGSLQDPDLPRGGRPLHEIEPARIEGAPPLRTVPEPVPASVAAQDRFADHVEAWWTRAAGPGGVLHGVDLRRPGAAFGPAAEGVPAMERYRSGEDREAFLELLDRTLDPHEDGDEPCACRALLYAVAGRPGLPNIVLLQFAFGKAMGERLWAAARAGDPGAPEVDLLHRALQGDHRRPDPDRLARAIDVLREVEGLVDDGFRAPVTAMLAWLFWACGGGTIAGRLADRALAEDPDQELATIVRAFAGSGRLPAWAFSEDPTADPWAVPAA